jgi:hypothetical protein
MNKMRWLLAVVLVVGFSMAWPALGQEGGLFRGATGSVTGTVVEVSPTYVLVRPAGEAPRRLYFPASDAATGPATAPAKVKAGDVVEAGWIFTNHLEVTSIRAAPPVIAAAGYPAVPATAPAPSGVGGSGVAAETRLAEPGHVAAPTTTGERVNAMIDNLLATANRLLELPLVVVLGAVAIGALGVALVASRLLKKSGRAGAAKVFIVTVVAAGVVAGLFVIDRKISRLEDQVAALRAKSNADTSALLEKVATAGPSRRQDFFVDVAAVNKALTPTFGQTSIRPLVYDEATDLYQVHTNNPLAQAWLTIVDLANPNVRVKLHGDFTLKTLTSAFARDNDCTVAINGEAGRSPEQGSGLGTWSGYFVANGKTLLTEAAGNPRPFLSFDAKNRATFRALAAKDRTLPADPSSVIWGRLDAIIDGTVQTADERNRQPRTAMGISADGTKLYLMVVDGRQPRYSMGFSRGEVGTFLKAFGASNGMLCDEGGSSCMFLSQFGGIANVPSDNNGQERPTYTHFGISVKSK